MQSNRFLLKLSGEVLGSRDPYNPFANVDAIVDEIIKAFSNTDKQLGIVIGGGNFVRGRDLKGVIDNTQAADFIGMRATESNALMLRESFRKRGVEARYFSMTSSDMATDPSRIMNLEDNFQQGRIIIFGGGTGLPGCTTDLAATIFANVCKASVVLKATEVDGVYTDDPRTNPDATFIKMLTLQEALEKRYKIMDMAAIGFCIDRAIPIRVFSIKQEGLLQQIVAGKDVGTLITP